MADTKLDPVVQATALIDEMTDDELNRLVDYVRDELKDRARRRNRLAKAKIKIDDKVKIAGKTKPAYLQGLTGVIIEIRDTRVLMKFDDGPIGKFKSGNVLINPAILEVLS